jgi:peptidoglycan hydrolase-like protein with peptidoglycan-binding domain
MVTRFLKSSVLALGIFSAFSASELFLGTNAQAASTSAQTIVAAVPKATKSPILRLGSRGDAVKELQTLLAKAGVYSGAVDGIFGQTTRTAVINFQRSKNLRSDGIVGSRTWKALRAI